MWLQEVYTYGDTGVVPFPRDLVTVHTPGGDGGPQGIPGPDTSLPSNA